MPTLAPPLRPRRARPRLLAVLAAALTVASPAAAPVAARDLTVRARTQVSLELERRPGGVVIHGRLADDAGVPVPRENVHLALPGYPTATRTTDESGAFDVAIDGRHLALLEATQGQRLPWTLRYDGDRVYGDASAAGVLDLRRVPTRLTVTVAPDVVALDESEIKVHVDLAANAVPLADGEVRVRVGDGTELVGATGSGGRSTFLIRAGLLGSAGTYAIQARFLGDHLHAPAEAEASLRVLLPARITLRVGREGDVRVGRYRFSGRLSDADGPVAGATVAILATPAGTPADTPALLETLTATHVDGIFLSAMPASDLRARDAKGGDAASAPPVPLEVDLRAVYSPSDGRHQGAISRPVRVRIPAPPGVPARWYLLGLAFVFFSLLVAQALRHRLLGVAWARLRAGRVRVAHAVPAAVGGPEDPPFVVARAETRHARTDHLAGRVLDAHTQAPVGGASVRLFVLGREEVATTAADGSFSLGPLPPGRHRLQMDASDYLARELEVAVPHGGDLDGATFALVAIRRRLRDSYSRAVGRFGSRLAWGLDTPREAWVNARRAEPDEEAALLELRRLVERAWFSEHRATLADATRAAQLLVRLGARQ